MEVIRCKYILAWIGPCNKVVLPGHPFCEIHENVRCVSCGNPATHQCGETYQLVCGSPLCDNCHDIGNMKHVPKS
jgi:hypothetical protein